MGITKFVKAKRKDVIGGGNRGEMSIGYADLVKAFGKPHDCTKEGSWRSSDNKVRAEWAFKAIVRGKPIILTIYDYKQYDTSVEKVTEWSIGGKGDIDIAASFLAIRLALHCLKSHRVLLIAEYKNLGKRILMFNAPLHES
jgi:hypothetical protein